MSLEALCFGTDGDPPEKTSNRPGHSSQFVGLGFAVVDTGLQVFAAGRASNLPGPRSESRPRTGHSWQANAPERLL